MDVLLDAASLDVAHRGQVFTPAHVVQRMTGMIEHRGSILEPAAGNGHFVDALPAARTTAIEIDRSLCRKDFICGDFFHYPTAHQFDTIIGNPPYVRYKDILPDTLRAIQQRERRGHFDERSNLYLFFIDKCLDHLKEGGELIFITPRDFIKATSSRHLNRRLYEEGSFTHFEELGDERIFDGYTPNCVIFRWVKGRAGKTLYDGRHMALHEGTLSFQEDASCQPLSDFFDVLVGAVSGNDALFVHEEGADFVVSHTRKTGKTRRMLYNRYHPALEVHKERLLTRRIKSFHEDNWWTWGRNCPAHDKKASRIYVNAKTRCKNPFFTHPCKLWDGSVLALLPKCCDMVVDDWVGILNGQDWQAQGFVCGGRFLFSQRSLQNAQVVVR